jgi:hypothetical protein
MSRKPKSNGGAKSHREPGNAGSPASVEQPRPWTDDEMAAAKPLPMPKVEGTQRGVATGVPHLGKGESTPAGRPQYETKVDNPPNGSH